MMQRKENNHKRLLCCSLCKSLCPLWFKSLTTKNTEKEATENTELY